MANTPPTQAPTATELLADPIVQAALAQAWVDSLPHDPLGRHEEGGWVYMDVATGVISVRRAQRVDEATIYLSNPLLVAGSVVVATFHTHPNPSSEGWNPGPSGSDEISASFLGVPCLIRADDGTHTTGPASRRGGLSGGPGFPP